MNGTERMEQTDFTECTEREDREVQDAPRRGFPMNGLRICVDHYDGDLEGRIYSKMNKDAMHFANLGELLLRADALFDERGYPQNFQEKRSFAEHAAWSGRYEAPKVLRRDEEVMNQKGGFCTFDVLVSSRRRASWQGFLMEGGHPRESFQSVKELLELIMKMMRAKETEHI